MAESFDNSPLVRTDFSDDGAWHSLVAAATAMSREGYQADLRTIDDRRLRVALDFALNSPTIRGARRTKRLHLVANNLDWSHGDGAEVRGPGEALLMAMAGRRDALKDLDGPGKDDLADRLAGFDLRR